MSFCMSINNSLSVLQGAASPEELVKRLGGSRVITKILIANNGIAAVRSRDRGRSRGRSRDRSRDRNRRIRNCRRRKRNGDRNKKISRGSNRNRMMS